MYGVSVEEQENYKITAESLKKGKVGVPYSDKIEFGKPADVEDADIEIKSNSRYVKYGGLSLSADGTFAGTPDRFVYYDWGDTVDITFEYYCKGYLLDSKTLTLTVEGYTQIPYWKVRRCTTTAKSRRLMRTPKVIPSRETRRPTSAHTQRLSSSTPAMFGAAVQLMILPI